MNLLLIGGDIDHQPVLLRFLQHCGHSAAWARNAELADRALGESRYDAVVLDLALEATAGNALDWLRECRRRRFAGPLLALAASTNPAERIGALDAGADGCLPTPFHCEELLARLRSLLRPRQGQDQWFEHRGIRMERATRSVHVDGEQVHLTAHEYVLLETFLRDPGRVLSRQELGNALWPPPSLPEPNCLHAHVSRLRRKLAGVARTRRAFIRTVRGVGYQMT